jgi:hypothetical protein
VQQLGRILFLIFFASHHFHSHVHYEVPYIMHLMKVSHYPPGYEQGKIVGMGMNEDELKRNSVSCID